MGPVLDEQRADATEDPSPDDDQETIAERLCGEDLMTPVPGEASAAEFEAFQKSVLA